MKLFKDSISIQSSTQYQGIQTLFGVLDADPLILFPEPPLGALIGPPLVPEEFTAPPLLPGEFMATLLLPGEFTGPPLVPGEFIGPPLFPGEFI